MIKSLLLAAAVTIPTNPLCAPLLAGQTDSQEPKPVMASSMKFGAGLSAEDPPSLSLGYSPVDNNIVCRERARTKFRALGARNMSAPESNTQYAYIGNMQAIVWCRENHAVIGVAGHSFNSVKELRDVLLATF